MTRKSGEFARAFDDSYIKLAAPIQSGALGSEWFSGKFSPFSAAGAQPSGPSIQQLPRQQSAPVTSKPLVQQPVITQQFQPPSTAQQAPLSNRQATPSTDTSGFISQRLTQSAGGGVHQYSKQKMMTDEELQSKYGPKYESLRNEAVRKGINDPKRLNELMNLTRVESGFNPAASGDVVEGKATSFGPLQIHGPAHPDFKYDPKNQFGAFDYGVDMYKKEGNKPWITSARRLGLR
jgi:hypothetical protein